MIFTDQPIRPDVTLSFHFDQSPFGGVITAQPFQQGTAFARTMDFQRCKKKKKTVPNSIDLSANLKIVIFKKKIKAKLFSRGYAR